LIDNDFIIGVISSGGSKILRKHLQDLNIPFIYLGVQNKVEVYQEIKTSLSLEDHHFSHMGDGPLDAELFSKVGFSISVPNAPFDIKSQALYCTQSEGGWGAVAEVAKLILYYQRGYH
jgi:3-deoxy-D-manno-octulosonate 8-phosphate phosphatase (KDO 8-P phosphatase)